MTINDMNYEEFEYLIQALGAKKDWPNLVEEVLLSSVRPRNDNAIPSSRHQDEQRVKASELLEFLDQRQVPIEFICSWVLIVYTYREMNMLEFEDENRMMSLQEVENLLKEFPTFDNDVKIGLLRTINTLLCNSLQTEVESVEQAHIILQILLSQSNTEGISFEHHLENKEICRFWNHIVGYGYASHRDTDTEIDTMVTRSPSLSSMPRPHSAVWGDYDKRRTRPTNPEDVEHIIAAGDAISGHIFTAAKFVQGGLDKYIVPTVIQGIEAVGEIVINNTEPKVESEDESDKEQEKEEEDDMKEFLDLTDASVKTTDSIRRGTRSVVYGVRDFSTRKVQSATDAWKEKQLGKQMIPDDDVRETVVATGKVGMATVGAAVLLTESIFEITKAIAQTSVKVASEVATHKYGEDVGKLVNNTGVASGNVLRTITHVGMMEAQVLTKAVASNTAKVEMEEVTHYASKRPDLLSLALKESVSGLINKPPGILDEASVSIAFTNFQGSQDNSPTLEIDESPPTGRLEMSLDSENCTKTSHSVVSKIEGAST
jgi:hypothetical protein